MPLQETADRYLKNTLSNIALLGANLVIGLWLIPFLVRHLGLSRYGIIPIAASLTAYMALATSSINAGLGRYVTFYRGRKDYKEANVYFSTGVILTCLMLIPVGLLCIALVLPLPGWFDTAHEYVGEFRELFLLSVLAFAIAMITGACSAVFYCNERFDLRNYMSGCDLFVRIGLIYAAFIWLGKDSLGAYGTAVVVGALTGLFGTCYFGRRLDRNLSISWHLFQPRKCRALLAFSGWVFVNQIGATLFLNSDAIVIGACLGTASVGLYSLAVQWCRMLRSIASSVAGPLSPVFVRLISEGKQDHAWSLALRSCYLLSLLILLPVTFICGLGSQIFETWLGSGYEAALPALRLLVFPLLYNIPVYTMFGLLSGLGVVKEPAFYTLITATSNIAFSVWFVTCTSLGITGVALASAVFLTFKNVLLVPRLISRLMKASYSAFLLMQGKLTLLALVLFLFFWKIGSVWKVTGWFNLIGFGLVVGLVYSVIICLFFLKKNERVYLLSKWSKCMPLVTKETAK